MEDFSPLINKLKAIKNDLSYIRPQNSEPDATHDEISEFELVKLSDTLKMLLNLFKLTNELNRLNKIIDTAPNSWLSFEIQDPPHISGYYGTYEMIRLIDDIIFCYADLSKKEEDEIIFRTGSH